MGSWTKAVTMGFMLSVLSLCIRYGRRPGLALGLPAPRVEPLKELHPEKHGDHEHADGRITADERGQRGPGTETPKPPAHAEDGAACEKLGVQTLAPWEMKDRLEDRSDAPENTAIARGRYGDGAQHHPEKGRVPAPGHIEKADDLVRLGHAGDAEPQGEEHAAQKGRELAVHPEMQFHREPPNPMSIASTVNIPVAMKVKVAAIERGEPPYTADPVTARAPLPSLEPKPTRNPAAPVAMSDRFADTPKASGWTSTQDRATRQQTAQEGQTPSAR